MAQPMTISPSTGWAKARSSLGQGASGGRGAGLMSTSRRMRSGRRTAQARGAAPGAPPPPGRPARAPVVHDQVDLPQAGQVGEGVEEVRVALEVVGEVA